jgi:5'-nucleotidase
LNILLTNDDGYQSVGLQLMSEKLAAAGHDIYVVAPDGQRSAFSHSINFHKSVKFLLLDDYFGAQRAYHCSGSPSDCVKFALLQLGVKFDMVVSGPNNGENYGFDILYSGTVGAAEEALICGVPAIAISRCGFTGDFNNSVDFVVNNIERLAKFRHRDVLLNINVPNLPSADIKGVVVTSQGRNLYRDFYVEEHDGNFRLEGEKQCEGPDPCDVTYTDDGYITITPITICQTHAESIDVIKDILEV